MMLLTVNSPRERELRGRDTRRCDLPMLSESRWKLNPSGMCMCGCGQPAPLAGATDNARGYVKGEPMLFVRNHHQRGVKRSEEERRRMRETRRGTLRGAANPQWKGGRTFERNRICVRVGRDHPMADRNGLVLEHRYVVSQALGRMLDKDEAVHHVNRDPFDNRPGNLVLVSRAEHAAIHALLKVGFSEWDAVITVLRGAKR